MVPRPSGVYVRPILDFKAEPVYILPSLEVIHQHKGDWNKIREKVLEFARSHGSRATEENVVSAYVTPTLRNLRLAAGKHSSLRLTSDGVQCRNAYLDEGMPGFLKRLGLQLIMVDKWDGLLLSHLMRNRASVSDAITIEQLKLELYKMGHREALLGTRVAAWITFLKFVDLVRYLGNRFYARSFQYHALLKGERVPSSRKFVETLWHQYKRLRTAGEGRGSPYVPIPVARDRVCSELGITTFTFDGKLREAVRSSDARIVLSTPMRKKEGGLTIGNKYYYLVAIYL